MWHLQLMNKCVWIIDGMVLTREIEVLKKEKLSQCPSVYNKFHMDWPRIKPGPLLSRANDWSSEPWHGLTSLVLYTYLMRQNRPVEVTSSPHQ